MYELDTYETNTPIVSLENEHHDFIKITSPLDKNTYQIDPSIPLEKQSIQLNYHTNIDFDTLLWKVDGNIFEKAFQFYIAFKQARKVVFILEVWLFYSLSSLLSVKRPRSALRTCLNAI